MIKSFRGKLPAIDDSCFIADTAAVIGDVEIGPESSVWFGAVVRGDETSIRVGSHTNVQDNAVCHVTGPSYPLNIGNHVTVGHNAIVHGCTIEDYSVIGMGAVVLDGATVSEWSIVAAGAVVIEGFTIPSRSLVAGVPAKIKRELTSVDLGRIESFAQNYLELARLYLEEREANK